MVRIRLNLKTDPRQLKRPTPCVVCGELVTGMCMFYSEVYGDYELKRYAHAECYRAHPEPPVPLGPPEHQPPLVQLPLFEVL